MALLPLLFFLCFQNPVSTNRMKVKDSLFQCLVYIYAILTDTAYILLVIHAVHTTGFKFRDAMSSGYFEILLVSLATPSIFYFHWGRTLIL